MSDLFDLFSEPSEQPRPQASHKNLNQNQLAEEIRHMILKSHGHDLPIEVANDLADLFKFPPPWAPWAN